MNARIAMRMTPAVAESSRPASVTITVVVIVIMELSLPGRGPILTAVIILIVDVYCCCLVSLRITVWKVNEIILYRQPTDIT